MLVFIASIFVFPFHAKAGAWGEPTMAMLMDNIYDIIQTQIQGAITGTLKVAAVSLLNTQVAQMIGGTSVGNALFITDWYEFLYVKPAQQANLYMNDFFMTSTRGKYASANYIGSRDVTGPSLNYPGYLVQQAKQSIPAMAANEGSWYDLDEYCATPGEINGDVRCFSAYFKGINNPFSYTMNATALYATQMNLEIERAKVEAQSSGYIGKKEGGKTIAPAATIENMMSDVQNIGNNIIAAAQNPAMFLNGVVIAVVNKAVTGLIQKGIGKVQANIQREIQKVDNKIVRELNRVDKQLGPAAQFTRDVSQKTNIYVKPYTVPPPAAKDTGVYCGGTC